MATATKLTKAEAKRAVKYEFASAMKDALDHIASLDEDVDEGFYVQIRLEPVLVDALRS